MIENGRSYLTSNINIKGPHPVTKFVTDTTIKKSITNTTPKLYPCKTLPKQRTVKKLSEHDVQIIYAVDLSAKIDRINQLSKVPINSYTGDHRSSSSVVTAKINNQTTPGKSGQSDNDDGLSSDDNNNNHPLDRNNGNNNNNNENNNVIPNITNMDPLCTNVVKFSLTTNTY